MARLFEQAKAVGPIKPPAKTKKAPEITIEGMDKVAALDMLIKALEGLRDTEQAAVKSKVTSEFVVSGCAMKRQPPNFRGVETVGSASCELRKRSSRSALSAEEQVLFNHYGLPVSESVTVQECYRFNPEYSGDQEILEKVSKALERVKGLPEDIIQLQEGSKTVIAGDGALDALFTKPAATVLSLLNTVGVLVLKPKFDGKDLQHALNIVKPMLGVSTQHDA